MEQRAEPGVQIAEPNVQTARIIASSLAGGVALFWVVVWVMTAGGAQGISPGALPSDLAFWIWGGVAVAGFVGALVFRGRALRLVERARAARGRPTSAGAGAVQSNLLIAWALLEGPALLSAVFFMLLGAQQILWAAVAVYLLGVIVTFPRAEWFGGDEGRGARSGVRSLRET